MADLQSIKNRFGIIGNFPALNRALEKSIQVAPTDISVLVIGESGVGKEFIPKIIHSESKRNSLTFSLSEAVSDSSCKNGDHSRKAMAYGIFPSP